MRPRKQKKDRLHTVLLRGSARASRAPIGEPTVREYVPQRKREPGLSGVRQSNCRATQWGQEAQAWTWF